MQRGWGFRETAAGGATVARPVGGSAGPVYHDVAPPGGPDFRTFLFEAATSNRVVRPGRRPPTNGDRPTQEGFPSPERVIERAASATGDVEAAATFVEDGGLASLRAAVERADPATARRGRRALAAFEWIRWAAHAERPESNSAAKTPDG